MEPLWVNGLSVCVDQMGPMDAPVALFGNSLGADLSMWDAQASALAQDFRVIRFDTRGHGASAATTGDYSLSLLADDVLALMDTLGIERAHFIGLSLGGMIGQVLGAQAGQRLDSLTLCATFADAPRQLWADRASAVRATGVAPLIDATVERWFTPAFRQSNPSLMGQVRQMIARTSSDGYAGCAAAIRDMDLTGVPEQITCPTLVIAATDDPSASPEAMQQLHSRIPGARYAQIDQAAHLFTLEQPRAATDLIATFLHGVQAHGVANHKHAPKPHHPD